MEKKSAILPLFFLLIVFAGCAGRLGDAPTVTIENIFGDPNSLQEPPRNPEFPCTCYQCSQKPSIFGFLPFRVDSLVGEQCSFSACNNDTHIKLLKDYTGSLSEGTIPSFLAFGSGPTFSSFDQANSFCDFRMSLPVRWLTAETGSQMPIPLPGTAQCYLERTAIPLYILYSKDNSIDLQRTEEIAKTLDGIGPVYVATQPAYDYTTQAHEVLEQAHRIKIACTNCLTVLSLSENSPENLQALLGNPLAQSEGPTDSFDFIGIGAVITPKSAAGKGCKAEAGVLDMIGFTFSEVLAKYKKPSLWTYFALQEGAEGSCSLTPADSLLAYDYLYKNSQLLAYSGVAGVALLSFSDSEISRTVLAPNSKAGLLDSDGEQKLPALNSWHDNCVKYYSGDQGKFAYPVPAIYQEDGLGLYCTFSYNGLMEGGTPHPDLNAELEPETGSGSYSCSNCISLYDPPDDYYDDFDKPHFSQGTEQQYCSLYSQIDIYSGKNSIDPLFARAIAVHDSYLLPDSVKWESENGLASSSDGCWASASREQDADPQAPQSTGIATDKGLKCGLMGRPEYYGEGTSSCYGSDYNPFNPAHNACLGTMRLAEMFSDSQIRNYLEQNADAFGLLSDDGISISKRRLDWMVAYLAALSYGRNDPGAAQKAMSDFLSQNALPQNGMCEGNTNFISYVSSCQPSEFGNTVGNPYPKQIIAAYAKLKEVCGSPC